MKKFLVICLFLCFAGSAFSEIPANWSSLIEKFFEKGTFVRFISEENVNEDYSIIYVPKKDINYIELVNVEGYNYITFYTSEKSYDVESLKSDPNGNLITGAVDKL